MLVYENTILNKFIITFTSPFNNLNQNELIPYNDLDDLNILLELNSKNAENIYILISSIIDEKYIIDNCTLLTYDGNITIICKNIEYMENYQISNWHIYWTNAVTEIHKNYFDIDNEIINNLNYNYPNLSQRRLYEYLITHCDTNKESFINILLNKTLSMMLNSGRSNIENKQKEISRDIECSKTKIIQSNGKNIRYSLCISHHLETAYQILDRSNAEIVLLFNINLKKSIVNVSIISSTQIKSILSDKSLYKDNNIDKLKISFQEFLEIIEI